SYMKVEGCLSDVVDLVLLEITPHSTQHLRHAIVELITAIIFSFSTKDFEPFQGTPNFYLPRDMFKSLLGPDIKEHVRQKMQLFFRAEPTMTSLDVVSAYHHLDQTVDKVLVSPLDACDKCVHIHPWSKIESGAKGFCCSNFKFWANLRQIIGNGVVLLFIAHGP